MADDKDKKVDVDLSKLLGGSLGGSLGKLVDLASSLSQDGETIAERLKNLDSNLNEASSTREFQDSSGRSGVIGFRIRTGIGGETNVDTFGNVYQEGEEVSDVREPLTDIYDQGDTLSIIAEMPGVSEDAVSLTVNGMALTIEATGRSGRRYQKDLVLPDHANTEMMTKSYQNGILEITIPLTQADT
ncbi:MAG: Hsp20/alpha crystallin family protein [Deinococcota bacterium]